MILTSKYLVPKGYLGMTVYPFVFLKTKEAIQDKALVNHESIHLRQQMELLIIPFYLIYGIEFLIKLAQFKNRNTAYRNISFEKEAYLHETNLEYLKHRKIWSFLKYLRCYDF
ncbi:hypothetical protein VOI54_00095 [Tamlana sp. 2201CG12-4]|uniref:hypothetical protein n=1 Tax=Tamlana sp. 2201CG12-4 TaxID=3112582 RepID=UPI002DBA8666|nr:hypothetical protein [Tamlana sp. 2201CG12-4]MEC3905406.1 hypothetical protein [Tamlana sp. 2201CG12-4]